MTEAAAFIRRPAREHVRPASDRRSDDERAVITTWEFSKDRETILKADPEDIIFVEPDWDREDVMIHVGNTAPVKEPGFTNITDEAHFNTGFKSSKYSGGLQRVHIWNYEWYAGGKADEAAQLAQNADCGYIPVDGNLYCFQTHNQWDAEKKAYAKKSRLDEFGCYLRWSTKRSQYEVVYNPALIERRRNRASDPSRKKTVPIYCWEFNNLGRAVEEALRGKIPGISISWWTTSRWEVIANLKQILRFFHVVYRDKAIRRLPAFQDFMVLWKQRGEKTKTAYTNKPVDKLFAWFDDEAKARKPAKAYMGELPERKGSDIFRVFE